MFQSNVQASPDYGKIKGTITWQYNKYVGTKGDVGAQIYVIPTSFSPQTISEDDEKAYFMTGKVPKNSMLFYTTADGYGNYEIDVVPAGEYCVFIISMKTTRDFTKPVPEYTKNALKPYIRNWDTIEKGTLVKLHNHVFKNVEIRSGITTIFSHDFGFTYI